MALTYRAEIMKSLRATPVVVRALTEGLTPEAAGRRPGGDEWAVIEVVAHLADTDERALARVHRMLREDTPALPAFDPARLAVERGYINMDLASEVRRYEAGRTAHLELLSGLEDVEWDRVGRHEEHGLMSIELYEAHTASEDVDHLAQIARLLTAERIVE